jgi:hypothetical protein
MVELGIQRDKCLEIAMAVSAVDAMPLSEVLALDSITIPHCVKCLPRSIIGHNYTLQVPAL